MQDYKIILLAVLAAISYGILHDLVTTRICLEYFTIGHPPVFNTTSPTLLALGWGVVATWWVGLPLGLALAVAARSGSKPKRTAGSLIRPVAVLLIGIGLCALSAGMAGAILARNGTIVLPEPLVSALPRGTHIGFLADAWAHATSYLTGILGGCALCVWIWRSR